MTGGGRNIKMFTLIKNLNLIFLNDFKIISNDSSILNFFLPSFKASTIFNIKLFKLLMNIGQN